MDILSPKTKIIFDNLFDGVYVVDRDRRIVYWNRAADRITGPEAGRVGRAATHIDTKAAKPKAALP